jgi:hypothetical protein
MVPNRKGNDGPMQWMLAKKPNGGCIYLRPFANGEGCAIHDDAPVACKAFDCRAWWRSFTVAQQDMIMADYRDRRVAEAARERL